MKTNKQQLMKHFATVLRNLALGKETNNLMSKNLVFYFTRKELIEILKKKFGGTIPKEYDLMEMENRELLELVDNELFIISYITEKWSREPKKEKTKKVEPVSTLKKEQTAPNKKGDNSKK